MRSPGLRRTLVVVAGVLVVVLGWWLYDPGSGGNVDGRLTNQTNTGPYSASTAPTPSSSGTSGTSGITTTTEDGLPTVSVDDLPPEARDTLALVSAGGPFPYDQDGITFENREGLLPPRDSGYYREYTVVTPGSPDRGARRIIVGSAGEQYYTADHYASFARIEP